MRWPVHEFEVLAWRGGHGPPRRYVSRSAPDVLNQVTTDGGPLYLEVMATCLDHADVGLGVLELWLNTDGLAWMRLVDSQAGYFWQGAGDPSRAGLAGEVGGFFDDTTGPFAVPAAYVITARQAIAVLAHWLDCGGRLPGLSWS